MSLVITHQRLTSQSYQCVQPMPTMAILNKTFFSPKMIWIKCKRGLGKMGLNDMGV